MSAYPCKLLVVDDHVLFRRGLVSLLQDFPEFSVAGEASNGKEGLELAASLPADLILLDLNMPEMDGLEMLRRLRERGNRTPVLMLTISQDTDDLLDALRSGAQGYILKSADPESLRKALLQVARGQGALSPEVIAPVLQALSLGQADAAPQLLTEREVHVLECLSEGLTTSQTGARLFISENTVKTHIRHILEKLEAGNRAEAVARAAQLGLLRTKD